MSNFANEILYMNPAILEYICCPVCKGALNNTDCSTDKIIDDVLKCEECGATYEVKQGVPILLSDSFDMDIFTGKKFAEEWVLFHEMGGLGKEFEEKQFIEYFGSHDYHELFEGKTVIEGGCGNGRNLIQAREWGASLAIGIEIGPSVFVARQKGADVVMGDILNPPFRKQVDMVFTIGVLQHVSQPREGLQKLLELVKPGGFFAHTVYSLENNGFLKKYFTPLRERFFRYYSQSTKYRISQVIGFFSYTFFILFYKPFSFNKRTNTWASDYLFYYDFIIFFTNKLGYTVWVAQIFDHLTAPLAEYFPRQTIEQWICELGLISPHLDFRNKNSWNFGGFKHIT